MAIGSGLSTQFGMKAEAVFGTPVTPDAFTYINNESIKAEVGKIESPFLGNLVMRTNQVKTYVTGAQGDIEFPFFNKGMLKILRQCYGLVTSAQVGVTAEYTHTFTLDTAAGKLGMSATVQIGRPATSGTVHPFTYEGGKVVAFSINLEANGLVTLATTWAFEDEKTATALATPSFVTNLEMFDWSDATVTLGGSTVFVRSFSINHEWAFDLERRGLSQTLRKEPIANGMLSVTGEMEGEFESLTNYNSFVAGTQQALVFTVTGSTIPTAANPYKLVNTCAKVELTGDTPNVGGPEILTQPLAFRALYDGTNPITQLVVHNDETTAV